MPLRGGGDVWDLASSGAVRESVAGMAAGLVGGADPSRAVIDGASQLARLFAVAASIVTPDDRLGI